MIRPFCFAKNKLVSTPEAIAKVSKKTEWNEAICGQVSFTERDMLHDVEEFQMCSKFHWNMWMILIKKISVLSLTN